VPALAAATGWDGIARLRLMEDPSGRCPSGSAVLGERRTYLCVDMVDIWHSSLYKIPENLCILCVYVSVPLSIFLTSIYSLSVLALLLATPTLFLLVFSHLLSFTLPSPTLCFLSTPAYLSTNQATYQPTHLHTYLLIYQPTYLPTNQPT